LLIHWPKVKKSQEPVAAYNPLDKKDLGRSVAEALLLSPVTPLTRTEDLSGAGVYVVYYIGNIKAYQPIVVKNRRGAYEQPIYVGKAVPKGARKGGLSLCDRADR